jgi:hypothetical protein
VSGRILSIIFFNPASGLSLRPLIANDVTHHVRHVYGTLRNALLTRIDRENRSTAGKNKSSYRRAPPLCARSSNSRSRSQRENQMAKLVGCRECGIEVSKSAKTCPHCGVSHPGTSKLEMFGGAVIFIGLVISGVAWMNSGPTVKAAATSTAPQQQEAPKLDEKRPIFVGQKGAILCPARMLLRSGGVHDRPGWRSVELEPLPLVLHLRHADGE